MAQQLDRVTVPASVVAAREAATQATATYRAESDTLATLAARLLELSREHDETSRAAYAATNDLKSAILRSDPPVALRDAVDYALKLRRLNSLTHAAYLLAVQANTAAQERKDRAQGRLRSAIGDLEKAIDAAVAAALAEAIE